MLAYIIYIIYSQFVIITKFQPRQRDQYHSEGFCFAVLTDYIILLIYQINKKYFWRKIPEIHEDVIQYIYIYIYIYIYESSTVRSII